MKKATDVTFILDRSGSMHYIKEATIEGFNSFLKKQKESKYCTKVSLVQFDDQYEKVYTNLPIEEVNYLNNQTFQPRGATALLDAIGTTIKSIKKRRNEDPQKAKKSQVAVVILTDGEENASMLYSRSAIFKKIRKCEEKHGWNFVFIGANQDAIREASRIGIPRARALEFQAKNKNVNLAFQSLSTKMMAYQDNEMASMEFDEEDRKLQED